MDDDHDEGAPLQGNAVCPDCGRVHQVSEFRLIGAQVAEHTIGMNVAHFPQDAPDNAHEEFLIGFVGATAGMVYHAFGEAEAKRVLDNCKKAIDMSIKAASATPPADGLH